MSTPKKPKKAVNATAIRRGHQLPARANDSLWADLKAVAKDERRSVAQTVIILLEEALKSRGRLSSVPAKESGS